MRAFGVRDVQAITSIVARCPAVLASGRSHVTSGGSRVLEMALREGSSGAGFEVAFEADCAVLAGEFKDDVQPPWSPCCCMAALPSVVCVKSCSKVRGQADVVADLR